MRVTGGGGSDFSGVTQVDVSGALTGITILDHGHSFTSDPDAVSMYYNGTDVKMVCPCLAHLLFCIIGCLSCVCVRVSLEEIDVQIRAECAESIYFWSSDPEWRTGIRGREL